LVKNPNAQKWVEYICFNYDVGKLVHELGPEAQVAYLNGDKTPQETKGAGYTRLYYHFSVYEKNPKLIKKTHDIGMTINV